MSSPAFVTRLSLQLHPDPARVVIRPYVPADDPPEFSTQPHSRAQRIADRVLTLEGAALEDEFTRLMAEFATRHQNAACAFLRRFHEVEGQLIQAAGASHEQSLLIGAYFCHEYSYEAAALFNPSIVPHPDQSGLPPDTIRFVMSLRGVGEGHVSSIAFRTGTCGPGGAPIVDPPVARSIVPRVEFLDGQSPDAGVRILCDGTHPLSECVIVPSTPSQRHGIEDLRLVRFVDDDGSSTYLGTYTAYSGQAIRQEVLRTVDFRDFELRPLTGSAASGKGMALFPRRVGGRYAMLSRHDHENLWFLTSDSLHQWSGGVRAVAPRWPWEFVQVGNCGSPIEIEEGWLVVTHGVGVMRNYGIGACLLDRDDPSKLLARMSRPLVRADGGEREGYVPNVTYSCGAMVHGRVLVLPYAIADSFTTFATVPLDALLAEMS
ncbi:glycoside hydrolase family 130 protein [Sphingomonas canadensis]|uniref:Glycoside hydrolase family 130 protein n=1 Tax=Sphingomonas canadensis TaxID=1219257 RepID=A0ABW3HD78_9SPHN|nr:glycoside hydrolase family 130 protein [Sphingomonas canadensis]MCW3837310.1 glycoside hydrolase family 130 protein [Sphingomonas canadensis]